jgi:hypothetical protein
MMWLLPLAALGTLEGDVWAMLAIAFATALTSIFYPSLWGDYETGLRLFGTVVLVARNLILLAVWLFLLRETIEGGGGRQKT